MTKPAIKLKDEQIAQWRERIDESGRAIEKKIEGWRENLRYLIGAPLDYVPTKDMVLPPKDWQRVRQKLASLFFTIPQINLKPRQEMYKGASQQFAAVLNFYLDQKMEVGKTIDEVLTDVLAVSGIGVSKIGYSAVTEDVEMPVIDVSQLPPDIAAQMMQSGEIPTEKVPQVIHEEYFWKRVTPSRVLLPVEFSGTAFDEAPWIGMRVRKPLEVCKREYKLPEDFKSDVDNTWELNDEGERSITDKSVDECEVVEIWYKAHLYDKSVKNPLLQRRLVFIEGIDDPVVHEDSPYQRFDENGKFLVGMRRYPIRILTLTTIPDTAIPPSDSTVARPLVKELHEGRTSMVQQRRRSIPLRWYNAAALDETTIEKIERGEIQDMIPLPGPADTMVGEIARANYPRETFEFQRIIENDLDEVWSIGANQLGTDSPGEVSATEVKTIQGNVSVRLDYERNRVLRWFIEGVECIGSLLQLFADEPDFVEVVGQDGLQMIQQWDRTTIAGEFVYGVKPNSQLRLDVADERRTALQAYQLLANEPFINRQHLVEWVMRVHDIDISKAIAQPPPRQPEPPNISYRFAGDDLNPLSPSFPIVVEILRQAGVQVPQEAINASKAHAAILLATQDPQAGMPEGGPGEPVRETEHGGPAEKQEPLSKHQLDRSGGF